MSIGPWQIIIIVIFVMLFFVGPKRLPGFGKSLGEAIRGFKKGISEDNNKDEDKSIDVTNSSKEHIDSGKSEAKANNKQTEKNTES